MIGDEIKKSLIKIDLLWENISNESSDDLDAYDFISIQSLSLKMTVLELEDYIDERIRKDKKAKLKFQKLQKALRSMIVKLDFNLEISKDREYIEDILLKLSEIKNDIAVVRQYQ